MRIALTRRIMNSGDTRRWIVDGPDGSVSWALLASPRLGGEDTPGPVEIHSPWPQWVDHIIATQCPVLPKCYANSIHLAGHKLGRAWEQRGRDDEVIWSELARWYHTHLVSRPLIRTLSLGAGVQSTAIYLLACEGVIPRFDAAIFADTGWEPRAVYDHLDRLEAFGDIPIRRVSSGHIRNDALDPAHRFASMPLFVKNRDGSDGMARRQCTGEYKLKPIKEDVRVMLGYPHPTPVPKGVYAEVAIGISTDEIGRARDSDVKYMRNVFPLLDLGMSRKDCERYLRGQGWGSVAKSACIGCPFHGNRQWRELRDTCLCGHHRDKHWGGSLEENRCMFLLNPDAGDDVPGITCDCPGFTNPEWSDAVDFDAAIRNGSARANAAGKDLRGSMYLHRSRVPLGKAPIDRVTAGEWKNRQGDLFDDLYDADEDGDPDGCGPFTCRSGEPVTE